MIKNKDGIALIVALILSAVSLMLIGLALYISTQYTKLSGRLKLYVTALSAANGAYDITTVILPSIKQSSSFDLSGISSLVGDNEKCLYIKLNYLTQYWSANPSWSNYNCPNTNEATSANENDIIKYYDLKYKLGDYYVFVKIISSSLGNTRVPQNTELNSGGVTSPKTGVDIVTPPKMPHLYRVEILSENNDNSNDKVHVTALFAY